MAGQKVVMSTLAVGSTFSYMGSRQEFTVVLNDSSLVPGMKDGVPRFIRSYEMTTKGPDGTTRFVYEPAMEVLLRIGSNGSGSAGMYRNVGNSKLPKFRSCP